MATKKGAPEAGEVATMAGEAGEVAGMSTEQEQERAALALLVNTGGGERVTDSGEPAPEPEQAAQPARMDAAESLGGLLSMLGGVVEFAGMKRTAEVWNAETCQECAARTVPVLRKYPWGVRVVEFLETGAGVEEVALAVFLFPAVMATRKAIAEDARAIAEAKEAAREQKQQRSMEGPGDADR